MRAVERARPRVTAQIGYGAFGGSAERAYRFLADLGLGVDRPTDTWVFWFCGPQYWVDRLSTAEVRTS